MHQYSLDFLRAIPKTDLHVHLDGSLRLSTLIDLAKQDKVELPSYTEEGMKELVFKPTYKDLDEYLKGFAYTCAVMRSKESIERIAYELAMDNFAEGVRYIEARFAPQLNMSDQLSFEDVMEAADAGFKKARKEINSGLKEDEPGFEYGIICCAMRFFNEHFSPYYKSFAAVHRYSTPNEIIQLASMELSKAVVKLRNETDIQVVGFDLAGSEYGYPADDHKESYAYIHKNFMKKTVHAGEAFGPESIFLAITETYADRIGHGLFLFDESMIVSKEITDKKKFVDNLSNFIADKRITVEVCLTSNMQTVPNIGKIENHSFGKMLDKRLAVSLCTDNRLVSHTNVTNEYILATNHFDIDPSMLKDIIVYGFKRSFFYRPYFEKRPWVRDMINYYEKLEKQFNIR